MKAILLQAVALTALAALASAQVPAGGEFPVNTFTTYQQGLPHAAMEPDGDFVVAWHTDEGPYGQRFAASGARRGGEFRIDSATIGAGDYPAIAVGRSGEFVVVWQGLDPYGGRTDILGRRYDASGNTTGGEFTVNTYTTEDQGRPRIGRATDGRFVVTWTSRDADGSSYGIAARRFDPRGTPIGSEFVVNTFTTGAQILGDVAVEANGNFVVAWEDFYGQGSYGSGIFGQRYDASGNRLGSEFRVNSNTIDSQSSPSVSVSPVGGFVVAWTGNFADGGGTGVLARRFDGSGNAVGDEFIVNTYTTGNQRGLFGQVAHDARGNFVVTWRSFGDGSWYGSFAQRFSAAGVRRGVEFRVNTYTTLDQVYSSVVSDSVGNFLVAWMSLEQDGDDYGVFAQRFGGLGPAALTVDTAANQVLEPGEAVDVRPTWRNINGAAQTFSGTLTDITGPAGATYTITDPTGAYGTVPNDTNGPCVECYSVSVSNPPTRPAVHWDAAAVESILPDVQGQQKQWRLHVGGSFTDVPVSNGFYRFVETLLHHSVTGGCSPMQYCPARSTTREQMAVFVLVAKEGPGYVPPACTTPVFADVPASSPFCRWIEELARRAVVTGCGGGNYCPSNAVTRDQMAVFVLRTLDPTLSPPVCAPPNTYDDVPETNPFCPWIEELTRRGVVSGCGGGNYCPNAAVTREQMGVFISATFGLTLYGP